VQVDADEKVEAERSKIWLRHWRLLEQCQLALSVTIRERDLDRSLLFVALTEELLGVLQLLEAERRRDRIVVAQLEVRCRDLTLRRRSLEAACSS
jgi:hypothetical protein